MLMNLIMGQNARKYSHIPVAALFIFANPHSLGTWVDENTDPSVRSAAAAYSTSLEALTERQVKAVEGGDPEARVDTLPNAHHYVYLLNQQDVLRDMRAFLSKLG